MKRAEDSLQYAVELVACSINWIIDQFKAGNPDKKIECTVYAQGESPETTRGMMGGVELWLANHGFVFVFSLVGLIGTIVATTLPNSVFLQAILTMSYLVA